MSSRSTKAGETLSVEPKAFRVLLILLAQSRKADPEAGKNC